VQLCRGHELSITYGIGDTQGPPEMGGEPVPQTVSSYGPIPKTHQPFVVLAYNILIDPEYFPFTRKLSIRALLGQHLQLLQKSDLETRVLGGELIRS